MNSSTLQEPPLVSFEAFVRVRKSAHVNDHDGVRAHAHPREELVVVLQISVSVLDDDLARSVNVASVREKDKNGRTRTEVDSRAQVAKLARVRREPDAEPPSRLARERQLFLRILERVLIVRMRSEREQLGRDCHRRNVRGGSACGRASGGPACPDENGTDPGGSKCGALRSTRSS